ncbi:hypothetical protein FQN60_001685, partial [Etheostoma spectabile]
MVKDGNLQAVQRLIFQRVYEVSGCSANLEVAEEIASTAKFGDLIEFSYPIGYSHWGVYVEDGNVIHFAVADQGQLMSSIRSSLQAIFPVCGDLLLGETKIRRVPLVEVNVPKGTHVLISNNRHAFTPSAPEDMRLRCHALLDEEFPYHLFTLNCEHFATFIRYGKAVCNQGRQVMESVEFKCQVFDLQPAPSCAEEMGVAEIPTRPKNVECVKATETFKNIASCRVIWSGVNMLIAPKKVVRSEEETVGEDTKGDSRRDSGREQENQELLDNSKFKCEGMLYSIWTFALWLMLCHGLLFSPNPATPLLFSSAGTAELGFTYCRGVIKGQVPQVDAGVGVGRRSRALGHVSSQVRLSSNNMEVNEVRRLGFCALLFKQLFEGFRMPESQHGSHLHGAILCCLLPLLEVVERIAALDPTGKLPAHHRLRNPLGGWLGGLPEFGVIKVSTDDSPGVPEPCLAPVFHRGQLGSWHHINKLTVSLEVHLKSQDKVTGGSGRLYRTPSAHLPAAGTGSAPRHVKQSREINSKKAQPYHGSWLCSCNNANQSEVVGLIAAERSWAVGCHHRDRLG